MVDPNLINLLSLINGALEMVKGNPSERKLTNDLLKVKYELERQVAGGK